MYILRISAVMFVLTGCSIKPQDMIVVVDDCGPAAGTELGVVFSLAPHGSGRGYLTAGSAMEVCPKITEAKMIKGYTEDLCKNHQPMDASECGAKEIFVITEVINE